MYKNEGLTINNFLEIYCLLLTPKDLTKFFSIHTVENKWMWGVDFLFGYFDIRVGLYNSNVCEHMDSPSILKSTPPLSSNIQEAYRCMFKYLESTPFDSLQSIIDKYEVIDESIIGWDSQD